MVFGHPGACEKTKEALDTAKELIDTYNKARIDCSLSSGVSLPNAGSSIVLQGKVSRRNLRDIHKLYAYLVDGLKEQVPPLEMTTYRYDGGNLNEEEITSFEIPVEGEVAQEQKKH
ncbi:MAG: hypothetical protein KAI53_01950 [Candidatus Aenigmarchaeota archaeon]|nr:hypothetical protein [Candidatus Aenigmarchaeota archaeon]